MKEFLKTAEIADMSGVSRRTVQKWIQDGLLPANRLPTGRDYRVKAEDFRKLCKAHNIPIGGLSQDNEIRVLAVDDDESVLDVIEKSLSSRGFKVATARNGFDAGTLLYSFRPCVMTLDLDMPQIDGEALLEKISGKSPGYDDGFLADLRIIIISGLSDAEIRRAMKAGAHAAIRKPFTVDELVNTVRALATSDAGS